MCKRPIEHALTPDSYAHCALCELELLRALVAPAVETCASAECLLSVGSSALNLPGISDEANALRVRAERLSTALRKLYEARGRAAEKKS